MKNFRFFTGVVLASFAFAVAGAKAAANDLGNVADAGAAASAKTGATGAEVVRGLQSLTPEQLDKVLAQVDKFDDNTKRQFKDAVLHPTPFTTSLLVTAADRISPESRQQLADAIVKVKGKK